LLYLLQAEYDAAAQQFILNTPDDEASKFWIGGAGQHGKICTVFAQLTVNGKWEGPHVFVVRLRDDAGNLAPGAPLCHFRCHADPVCSTASGPVASVRATLHSLS
jgi:alkylation response protein AidB-like acyl-CoA dehydrogenase